MKEFKDIAHHYLKSGLMFRGRFKGWAHFSNGDMTLCPIDLSNDRFDEMKPIMYDMSDIDKEITHNGETFVPLAKLNGYSNDDWDDVSRGVLLEIWESNEIDMQTFLQLIEWNFNCFGIENTINKMTYES